MFDEGVLTPNDAFFVRYHLAGVPLSIDPDTFVLEIKGKVDKPTKFSLQDLKQLDAIEIVAVNQCSGNGRGFFNPRVAGGQLGNGAMGNARWKGVPLKTVLDKAGVQRGARQVTFNGLDEPLSDKTPDFVKALDIDHALDGEVMLAYEMNGEDLPVLNGFPLRLIVPGYYGTYWVKHLNEITVIDEIFDGFWMKTAYRIPDNACACVAAGTTPKKTVPIERFNVRSFITNVERRRAAQGRPRDAAQGIAFDGGYGITEVAVSTTVARPGARPTLGHDLGKYSFREWTLPVKLAAGEPRAQGAERPTASANRNRSEPLWNPPGYMRNVVETVRVHRGVRGIT